MPKLGHGVLSIFSVVGLSAGDVFFRILDSEGSNSGSIRP